MELVNYQCELCNKDYKKEEVFLIKIDFRNKPPRIAKAVDEWHIGIRIVCKHCVEGLARLYREQCESCVHPNHGV